MRGRRRRANAPTARGSGRSRADRGRRPRRERVASLRSALSAETSGSVYRFRVSLREIAPPIWRLIEVPGDYTFWDLHVAIQDSMGWFDYHLHMFRVESPLIDATAQIGIPDEDAFVGDEPVLPGWEVPVVAYFLEPGDTALYEYDFGDGWEHDLTLEAITPREGGRTYPVCLAGERACPPEDCGGVGGYEHVLAVLRDPSDEEHESMLTWLGGSYDPGKFDPKTVKFADPAKRWKQAFEEA